MTVVICVHVLLAYLLWNTARVMILLVILLYSGIDQWKYFRVNMLLVFSSNILYTVNAVDPHAMYDAFQVGVNT